MKHDGYQTDSPIAETSSGSPSTAVEPQNRASQEPLTDAKGPWTIVRSKPPVLGVDDPATATFGAGRELAFSKSSRGRRSRDLRMTDLGRPADALAKLDSRKLTDGPWCPDPAAAYRYDADLLRVRKVRVTLRVQVGVKHCAAPAPCSRAGMSKGGETICADQEIKFEVTL